MNTQEKQAIKEVLFDYNAETIESAEEIADRILRKLNELRKPSEPEANVCEAGEWLVEKIELILNENRETDRFNRTALDWRNFHSVATEIASLMQPDEELLEAAKDALRTFYGIGCNEEAEIVQVLTKAILNHEKQSK